MGLRTWLVTVLTATGAICWASVGDAATSRGPIDDRAVVRGRATLDGASFDAPYLGAVVKRQGLVTPCQQSLPRVRNGRFGIIVLARSEADGCGAKGGQVYVWTFVRDQIVYSTRPVPWPGNGATVRFRPQFSTSAPAGGVGAIVGFAGEVFDRRHRRLPPGARVEAFVGTTRCGVATTRTIDDFTGFSIDVVGPDSIPSCTSGGSISFRVDGRRAVEAALNQPGQETSLNLTLQ